MATIERITSSGDAVKDEKAINAMRPEGEVLQSRDELEAREQKAREQVLEPPRNALVEVPYAAGETIAVVVQEGDEKQEAEISGDLSGADEKSVDRKTPEGKMTNQAIRSPQPPVAK
jgi:hypothetical protein